MRDAFRITLGLFFAVGAGCSGLIGLETLVIGRETFVHILLFYLLGTFFLSVALACFWERSQPVTVRVAVWALLLSVVVFMGYHALYMKGHVELPPLLGLLFVFGLPVFIYYLLLTAGSPSRDKHPHWLNRDNLRWAERCDPWDEPAREPSQGIQRPPSSRGRGS
jgi:hypothetical protein